MNRCFISLILLQMIHSGNKDYSFTAVTKHKRLNTTSTTINQMSPLLRSKPRYHQQADSIQNVTYVSPAPQKIKLTSLNNHHQRRNQTFCFSKSAKSQINAFSFKQFLQRNMKYASKTYYREVQRRKNIRQYFCQLSQDKKKHQGRISENKTQQLKPYLIKQQSINKNISLIVHKIQNSRKNNQATTTLLQEVEPPIHHTQIYLFAKKKVKIQPSLANIQKYLQKEDKQTVTMSKIIEFRENLATKYQQSVKQDKNLVKEIHPTIAIITNQQEIQGSKNTQNSPFCDKKVREQINASKTKTLKQRDQQQISPWYRKNIPEFQYN